LIVIGIGSNLAAARFASPLATAKAALAQLPAAGVTLTARSRWYASAPVPLSDQPWYVNGVAIVETRLAPPALLTALLAVERRFGRRRSKPNAARTLDLDLLDYRGRRWATARLTLPHPRLHERRFVLRPLVDLAPAWRHPLSRRSAAALLAALPPGQTVRALSD
jgi:2-amino-4-hydroxy-6-hydroxymethyldihydropteridine diphosphokinase